MYETTVIDDGYLGSGKHLKAAIQKYGKINFSREILSYHNTKEELYAAEAELITEEMLKDPMCMNIVPGGKGGSGPGILGASKGGKAFSIKMKKDPKFREKMLDNFSKAGKQKFIDHPELKEISKDLHKTGTINAQTREAREKRINTFKKIEHQKGDKNSQYNSTCIFNPNTKKSKRIKKDNIQLWLNQGWIIGSNTGTIFIYNTKTNEMKLIQREEIQIWLDQGWCKGMRPRKKKKKKK